MKLKDTSNKNELETETEVTRASTTPQQSQDDGLNATVHWFKISTIYEFHFGNFTTEINSLLQHILLYWDASVFVLILSLSVFCNPLPSLCHSGPRSELHSVTAHGRADPAQTQPSPQGPSALRQTHGVAEEHTQGEVRGPVQGQWCFLPFIYLFFSFLILVIGLHLWYMIVNHETCIYFLCIPLLFKDYIN